MAAWAVVMILAAAGLRAEGPNVLLILADDLGLRDLSCQGGNDVRTPHIDSIAGAGVRFESFRANCPVCSPTRAALLSGRYPELVGVPGVIRTHAEDSFGWLDPGAVLLPEILRRAGYVTALVGKWHLGLESPNLPGERGFERFEGFLGDMMDDYHDHRRHGINYMRRNREEIEPVGHATDLFSDWAATFVRSAASGGRPWFLYLAYNAPHTPIQPPAEWELRVIERESGIDPARAKLVALIEHMDAGIGRVLSALDETGQRGGTLVIFTSDNGGQLNVGADNGPWRGGKQDTYEGGLRVPAFAAWPGVIEPGSRIEAPAVTMDLFPTIAEAAGVEIGAAIDGVSLLPVMSGGSGASLSRRPLFFARREGNERYMGECIWAMIDGDWKLVKNSPFEPWELYNLSEDPGESLDLAGRERERFRAMARRMRAHIQRGGAVPWQRPGAPAGQ